MPQERYGRRLIRGDILFSEGEAGDCAYIVEAGNIEVSVQRDGKRHVLAHLGRGSLVGEMALLDRGTRTATVTAVEDSQLRRLERGHLDERLQDADPLLRNMLQLVLGRYRDVVGRLESITVPLTASGAARNGNGASMDPFPGTEQIRAELEIEAAVELGQFSLHYQPVMRLKDSTVAGFEALLRWQHPERGMIFPDNFVPLAEESGLIIPMGHWIIRNALAGLAQLDRESGLPEASMSMAINVSGRQFSDPELFSVLANALAGEGIDPARIRLEITESSLFDTMEEAAKLMARCNDLGVKLTVDDFGTGYSALSYLYRLPVSGVKLARPFIKDLAQYPQSAKIIGAVAKLAKELSLETVAEGIEQPDQAAAAGALGIEYGQGFHYSPAMPLSAATRFAQRNFAERGAERGGRR